MNALWRKPLARGFVWMDRRLLLVGCGIALVGGCRPIAESPTGVQVSAGNTSADKQATTSGGSGETAMITVTSDAFAAGKPIPKKYTADGENISPPLAWSGAPAGTKQFALICDDPDAPTPQAWIHWVLYKFSGDTKSLPENLPKQERLTSPPGALQGENSFQKDNIGYGGPAPPKGHGPHHYHFKLYALDKELEFEPLLDKKNLLAAIQGHVIAEGELIGMYER
jgi:Raf kinase inhibitor-like YbhB/YbcL family protein